jgi:alkaline phosphatase
LLLLLSITQAVETRAKNVILFIGDAGGIPTLNAAGIYAHNRPQSLFIQSMKDLALSDTSSLDNWVTDSAAGMTAIVTGQKTNNGMLSMLPGANGATSRSLKTIMEYAEERGLSTGVVTNTKVWDATPAACYAHATSRKSIGEIFNQILRPQYGDGVDVLIGADRKGVITAAQQLGLDALAALRDAHYQVFDTPSELTAGASRAVAIYDGEDFSPEPVIRNVIEILSRNPKGYFLMVEWDMHTKDVKKGLDRVMVMDSLIRKVVTEATADTLILYAADHSFDLRLRGGKRDRPLSDQVSVAAGDKSSVTKPAIRVDDDHTGEEILVTGHGPGAERLQGFISNTEIFKIMMAAYGWEESQ